MPLLKKVTGVAPGQDVAFVLRALRRIIEFFASNEARLAKTTTDDARNSEQSTAKQDEAGWLRSYHRTP